MAIVKVQATGTNFGDSASYRDIALTGVAAGNCLVLGASLYSYTAGAPGLSSVTEVGSSRSFTLGKGGVSTGDGNVIASVWYLTNCPGGSVTVRCTPVSGKSAYQTLCLAEFSGVDTGTQPKASAGAGGNGVTTIGTGSWSATPASGDLLVMAYGFYSNISGQSYSPAQTALYSLPNAGSNEPGLFTYAISDGTNTSQTASWTGSTKPVVVGVALSAAAAASTTKHFLLSMGCGT